MSRRKSDIKPIHVDLSKTYMLQMCKRGHDYDTPHYQQVKVSLSPNSKNMIRCDVIDDPNNEYDPYFLYDDYFAWLLNTNKIICVEE